MKDLSLWTSQFKLILKGISVFFYFESTVRIPIIASSRLYHIDLIFCIYLYANHSILHNVQILELFHILGHVKSILLLNFDLAHGISADH